VRNSYYFNKPFCSILEKPKKISKISSQILYGEKFKILSKNNGYFKIRTLYDNYKGYIKINNFPKNFKPNYKVKILKANIYKKPKNSEKTKQFLSFSSEINVIGSKKNFFRFEKNKWIKKNSVVKKKIKTKNYLKIFSLFKNCKYIWGGKTFRGIDCSALIQIYFKFNNKFYPRDTVDQIKFKKGPSSKINYKSGDLIYWKGHVALCINNMKLIHAYGPAKKVVIMPIDKTIKIIRDTAGLKIKKIFPI
tara:strand:- start:357 stop:1103 length:747 start_codon:yes stop_codon:yes gene_type:complete